MRSVSSLKCELEFLLPRSVKVVRYNYYSTQVLHTSQDEPPIQVNCSTVRQGDRHPCTVDPSALHAADTVQLQHFNPFYMPMSDTRAFVNKVAGSDDHGLPGGWQSALSPHDVHRNGWTASLLLKAVGAGFFPSYQATEPGRSSAEHVKLRSPLLLGVVACSGTVGF